MKVKLGSFWEVDKKIQENFTKTKLRLRCKNEGILIVFNVFFPHFDYIENVNFFVEKLIADNL